MGFSHSRRQLILLIIHAPVFFGAEDAGLRRSIDELRIVAEFRGIHV